MDGRDDGQVVTMPQFRRLSLSLFSECSSSQLAW